MKILFTGGSSFTGFWLIRELASAGHDVVATFQKSPNDYDGVRKARVDGLAECCHQVFDCSFGDDRFLDLIAETQPWDLLCHHAADARRYKEPDFDILEAAGGNSKNARIVLRTLKEHGCDHMLLTGTIFEPDEGVGSENLPAFSPYGVSKGLTSHIFRYFAMESGVQLGKFVISNAFGPYEEARFTSYLARSWFQGKAPSVNCPAYVRDNVHVSLLARAYVWFAMQLREPDGVRTIHPSGYIESQGAFALRMAAEMEERLDLPCRVTLQKQTEFTEPRIRINTDVLNTELLKWNEDAAWDGLAEYYRKTFG